MAAKAKAHHNSAHGARAGLYGRCYLGESNFRIRVLSGCMKLADWKKGCMWPRNRLLAMCCNDLELDCEGKRVYVACW